MKPLKDNEKSRKGVFRLLAGTVALLLAIGVLGRPSRIVLEKAVTALVMPAGVLWLLLFLLFVMAWWRRARELAVITGMTWVFCTVSGSEMVSAWLVRSLESDYVQVNPLERGVFDVVVVMGGGTGVGANGRAQGNGSGDRVILAAQMYHQGLTSKIICTGERIPGLDRSGFDPSQSATAVLKALGVPLEAIDHTPGHNTAEEMAFLGEQFGKEWKGRIGLITSAWHLPRTMRLAMKNAFYPEPLPADFLTGFADDRGGNDWQRLVVEFIPTAGAMAVTGMVSREYLAGLVGR